ncbi:nucleotidyltransferase domain-containing protein [bacterium]
MLQTLFSSKARVNILKLLLLNPKGSFYQREISSLTNESIRSVQREVKKLEEIGFLSKSIQGKSVYYRVNESFIIYEDLKNIFIKSAGIAEELKNHLKKTQDIEVVFVYGSYAKGAIQKSSDIDIFVIGTVTSRQISKILSKPQKELAREINYVVFTKKEFREKIRKKNHFVLSILKTKKIFIIGNEDDFKNIVKPR